LRLATFNLLHSRSLPDGTVHAGRVANAVPSLRDRCSVIGRAGPGRVGSDRGLGLRVESGAVDCVTDAR
jgi:hypothetical protein